MGASKICKIRKLPTGGTIAQSVNLGVFFYYSRPAELARIDDAIQGLNQALASFGVSFDEVHDAKAASAAIHIHDAKVSPGSEGKRSSNSWEGCSLPTRSSGSV